MPASSGKMETMDTLSRDSNGSECNVIALNINPDPRTATMMRTGITAYRGRLRGIKGPAKEKYFSMDFGRNTPPEFM
jgi:hypothetical protein